MLCISTTVSCPSYGVSYRQCIDPANFDFL